MPRTRLAQLLGGDPCRLTEAQARARLPSQVPHEQPQVHPETLLCPQNGFINRAQTGEGGKEKTKVQQRKKDKKEEEEGERPA